MEQGTQGEASWFFSAIYGGPSVTFSGCWDLIPDINNAKEGGFNLAYSYSPLWQEALVEQRRKAVGLGWAGAEGWGRTENACAN